MALLFRYRKLKLAPMENLQQVPLNHQHYAKKQQGFQRSMDVQRLVRNGYCPHASLGKNVTPAMVIELATRPIHVFEMLPSRSYQDLLL
jgi:hypothetical protein